MKFWDASAIVPLAVAEATLELVSLDDRLTDAAAREGFRIVTG